MSDVSVATAPPDLERLGITLQQAADAGKQMREMVISYGWSSRLREKDYLNVEAWQFLGAYFGITADTSEGTDVMKVGDDIIGARAVCRLIDKNTGTMVGGSSHICLLREKTKDWPLEHAYGMAQTRAVSRAYQQLFRWIAEAEGYAGTPKEEMDGVFMETDRPSKPAPVVLPPDDAEGLVIEAPAGSGPLWDSAIQSSGGTCPAFFIEKLGFGKFKEMTWAEMCQGEVDGSRHSYLQWMSGDKFPSDSPWRKETKRKANLALDFVDGGNPFG